MAKALALRTAIARGGGAAVSDAARASSTCGAGVFRGLGVSSFCADFDFALFFVLSDVFFAPIFAFRCWGVASLRFRRWRFLWFRSGRGACLGFLGLIAPFFFIDLRAKETRDQCAKCERSCEPNAKAHHCDGA